MKHIAIKYFWYRFEDGQWILDEYDFADQIGFVKADCEIRNIPAFLFIVNFKQTPHHASKEKI